jgi:hypothetical protein
MPPEVATLVNALCDPVMKASANLHRNDPLVSALHALAHGTLRTTLKALMYTPKENIVSEICKHTEADVDYLWTLHRCADTARPLVLRYAMHRGFDLSKLMPRKDLTDTDTFVQPNNRSTLLLFVQAALTPQNAELGTLKTYLRQLMNACDRMCDIALPDAEVVRRLDLLPIEEVMRRLHLLTIARLFVLSLSVAVEETSPMCLVHWLDARFVYLSVYIAFEEVALHHHNPASPPGRLFAHLCLVIRNRVHLVAQAATHGKTYSLVDLKHCMGCFTPPL